MCCRAFLTGGRTLFVLFLTAAPAGPHPNLPQGAQRRVDAKRYDQAGIHRGYDGGPPSAVVLDAEGLAPSVSLDLQTAIFVVYQGSSLERSKLDLTFCSAILVLLQMMNFTRRCSAARPSPLVFDRKQINLCFPPYCTVRPSLPEATGSGSVASTPNFQLPPIAHCGPWVAMRQNRTTQSVQNCIFPIHHVNWHVVAQDRSGLNPRDLSRLHSSFFSSGFPVTLARAIGQRPSCASWSAEDGCSTGSQPRPAFFWLQIPIRPTVIHG